MTFSLNNFQQAIYDVLDADATLGALINGVYSYVPADTDAPYVVIDPLQTVDLSTMSSNTIELALSFSIYSRSSGNKEANSIAERVHTLLHNTTPSVVGVQIISLFFVSSAESRARDGETIRVSMQFQALLR